MIARQVRGSAWLLLCRVRSKCRAKYEHYPLQITSLPKSRTNHFYGLSFSETQIAMLVAYLYIGLEMQSF